MGGKGEVYMSLCVFVGHLTAHNFCHLFMTAKSGIGELREISNTHTHTHTAYHRPLLFLYKPNYN